MVCQLLPVEWHLCGSETLSNKYGTSFGVPVIPRRFLGKWINEKSLNLETSNVGFRCLEGRVRKMKLSFEWACCLEEDWAAGRMASKIWRVGRSSAGPPLAPRVPQGFLKIEVPWKWKVSKVCSMKRLMLRSIWRLPPTQSTFTFQERLDGSSIGELLDFELPLKIVALAEEPAKQATKAGPFRVDELAWCFFLWRSSWFGLNEFSCVICKEV